MTMEQIKLLKQYADQLRLTNVRNNAEKFIHQAQIDKPGYMDYTCIRGWCSFISYSLSVYYNL